MVGLRPRLGDHLCGRNLLGCLLALVRGEEVIEVPGSVLSGLGLRLKVGIRVWVWVHVRVELGER